MQGTLGDVVGSGVEGLGDEAEGAAGEVVCGKLNENGAVAQK
jgi:hypothetical protein